MEANATNTSITILKNHSLLEVCHSDPSIELRTSASISSPNSVPTSGLVATSPLKIDATEVENSQFHS
ncbi:hypothetical protein MJO29_013232 [Puccinia striiformis f. sp. tritici]|uniref:Uncharacterized protein n=1 Tax=Puccinia striiformis TaxID=27350 RepID=A0A2S4UKF1_9BASI|nr:hypothetical protein MJO29_013232 [Puccinia striiformis f. sp. tritici]POV97793.1 hypothetical protein PSHT_14402 [Puccinia striiformis]